MPLIDYAATTLIFDYLFTLPGPAFRHLFADTAIISYFRHAPLMLMMMIARAVWRERR